MNNHERAHYGHLAISVGNPDHYANVSDSTEGLRTSLVDTLANILHCCHEEQLDFSDALRIAVTHFEAESHTTFIESQELRRSLIKAAQSVVDNWETGDLDLAVRELNQAIQDELNGRKSRWYN